METDGKQTSYSSSSSPSSSFANELFGYNESSSTIGVYGSFFPPSSNVLSDEGGEKQVTQTDLWSSRSENSSHGREFAAKSLDSIFKTEVGQAQQQPCHLSSSIYYGGQDIYSDTRSSQSSTTMNYKKEDVEEIDPHTASRGNWWQGSLYY